MAQGIAGIAGAVGGAGITAGIIKALSKPNGRSFAVWETGSPIASQFALLGDGPQWSTMRAAQAPVRFLGVSFRLVIRHAKHAVREVWSTPLPARNHSD